MWCQKESHTFNKTKKIRKKERNRRIRENVPTIATEKTIPTENLLKIVEFVLNKQLFWVQLKSQAASIRYCNREKFAST